MPVQIATLDGQSPGGFTEVTKLHFEERKRGIVARLRALYSSLMVTKLIGPVAK